VLYAEPNYTVRALAVPNDPMFPQLWGMPQIKATNAWDRATGSDDIVVCVIDTGVDYNHPDLAGNMWTNPGEVPGNGVDDDGNGYVDDVHGYDFVNNDGDPMDDHGHGTHCSGTIGGIGNNGVGVAGVNWKVRIMALKFLSASGGGSTADAIDAVNYSVQMGVRVSNNSWGGGGYSAALYDAINAGKTVGQLFCAAAGNDTNDNDANPSYPASYDRPGQHHRRGRDRPGRQPGRLQQLGRHQRRSRRAGHRYPQLPAGRRLPADVGRWCSPSTPA
jgi:serine protease